MSRESEKWNEFLTDLLRKLSAYEIQRDKKKYNIANIEHWGEAYQRQGIEITRNTVELFLNKIARYEIKEREYVKNITITESQLSELNHILSLTLKHKTDKSCPKPYELVIKGDYVKFSDFVNEDGNLNPSYGCKDVTAVKVFVLNTLFIDRDVKLLGKRMNISMISPKWEIINARVMELSGIAPKENHRRSRLNDGQDGEPGLPGTPGGNFFGIGTEFSNGKNFTIISNGGRGGVADDGNDGEYGYNAVPILILNNADRCDVDWCSDGRKFPAADHTQWICKNPYHLDLSDVYPNIGLRCEYTLYSESGSPGKRGGNGGKGGKGGNPGNIVIFELSEDSGISRYNETGKDGENGKGGSGGGGGIGDHKIHVSYGLEVYNEWRARAENEYTRQGPGENGIDGTNVRGMKNPESVVLPERAKIVRQYRSYLRENLNDRSKRHALMEFLQQLDNNDGVRGVYDTLELFDELKDLEKQFHIFNDDVDLVPAYQSLLNRISEYALKPRDIENSTQYKKVLAYLYTAILGKISYLEDHSESNLILDIDNHLDLVRKEFDGLKELQIASVKANLINSYKENYKRDIERQIDEAKNAIERQIRPSIDDINVRIDQQIDTLIAETRALENQAHSERENLLEKRDELNRAMKFKLLFNSLKFVGQVLGFLGPIGMAVGSLIGRSTDATVKSPVIDDRNDQRQNLKINVRSYVSQIETVKINEISKLNEFLGDITRKMNENPQKFTDTLVKIDNMKRRLVNVNEIEFHQVLAMKKELRDELWRKHKDLMVSTKEESNDGKNMGYKKIMANIEKTSELFALGYDIYDKYKDDEDKVNAISAAVTRKNEDIQELVEYENNIHDEMVPMMQSMGNKLRDIANDLNDKSQVSLDVTRWQVQNFLKDVKSKVKKVTGMFTDVNEDFSRCMEMLEDTMTTMIKVYDRIQDYQKEQKFVDFFTDVSYIAGSNVKITDPRLRSIVNESDLEKLIRSNHVIMRWKTVIEALKNFVFPLAHVYLKDFVVPSHFQLGSDFDNLLLQSEEQMKMVKSKVDTYKTYLNGAGYDPDIKLAPFKTEHSSTKPFFTWPNSQYKETISKLLSGQRVTVTADIEDSPIYKDAIKFSVAEFFFNARNKTMQSEINDVLKGFEVEALHRGDSHYRWNKKIYRLNSNVTSISYYLEKGADGKPLSKSRTYVNLEKSESILSPYATWEVILMVTGDEYTFRDLNNYKDFVDLELKGYGSYIDNRKFDYSKLMVDNYYRPIKVYKGINLKHQTSDGTLSNRQVRSALWSNDHSETSDESPKSLSRISNEDNFFNKTISKIKNLRAIKSITNWYGGKSINVDKETSTILDSPNDYHDSFESASIGVDEEIPDKSDSPYDVQDPFEFNTEPARNILSDDKVEWSSHQFIDNDNQTISDVDYNSLHNQANLLLLDLAIRTMNRTKYKNVEKTIRDDAVTENAQYLAYSAYVPENEPLSNSTQSSAP